MFHKKIASKGVEAMNKQSDFPLGTKFFLDDKMWIVTKVSYADNTQMREIRADDGTVEVLTLTTLQRDLKNVKFSADEKK